jgi:hypothetical protein
MFGIANDVCYFEPATLGYLEGFFERVSPDQRAPSIPQKSSGQAKNTASAFQTDAPRLLIPF